MRAAALEPSPARPLRRATVSRMRERGWQQPVSPSRLFILRPVATSLLDGGDHAGRHRRLPLPAALGLARGRLPDDPGGDALSRRQPRCDDLVGHRAARSRSSARCRASTRCRRSARPARRSSRLQFSLSLSLDVAEQEVQAAINAAGNLLPVRPAGAADLRQGQPGRRADPDPGADLEDVAADRGRGPRRHPPRAEDLAADRGRPRQHQRRAAPGGAHPGQSAPARRLWPQHRRSAHDDRQRQRQHAQGQFRRAERGNTRSTPTTS